MQNLPRKSGSAFDIRGLAIPALIIAIWALISTNGWGNSYIFVSFSQIGSSFWQMWQSGEIGDAIWATSYRMALGLFIGGAAGIFFGLLTGLSHIGEKCLSPTLHALRQIATFAWMPLLTAWLGVGSQTMIALIAIGAFYPMLINVEAGCRNVPKPWLEVAQALELSRVETIRKVVLPAATPAILAGVELATNIAWLSTIGAEYFISAGDGLGIILSGARMRGSMDGVIVGILLIGVVGLIINRVLALFGRRVSRWRAKEIR